jgi:hypothetical protein
MFFCIRTGLRHHRTALCDEPKLPGGVARQQQGLSCLAFQHFAGQQDLVEARRVKAQQADNMLFQQVKRSIPGHSNGAKLLQGGKRKESITENQTNRINYRLPASYLLDIRPDATAATSHKKSHQNAI